MTQSNPWSLAPRPAAALALTALPLFAVYMLFDLREGGRSSSLLTTRLSTPAFYVAHFGGWFFWGCVVLDAMLAIASSALIVTSLARFRARRDCAGGVCTSAAVVVLGYTLFGCPGCMVPLFGTLGVAFFANALPLFGLEFKILSLAVTLGAFVWTSRSSAASRSGWGAQPAARS